MSVQASVVIPAHDEAAVIDRLLSGLAHDPRADTLEIVVVANGCRDDTAARAAAHRGVRVVEIDRASKIAALNAADAEAVAFPRVYLDADVTIDVDTILALADELDRDGIEVASPRLVVDTSHASWAVRQHYRVWELSDYRATGHIGSGVYALSARGRARFDDWPEVIADDRFVQQLFAPAERGTLREHSFTVRSPARFASHLRRSTRIARGNRELAATVAPQTPGPDGASRGRLVRRVAARPRLWVPFAVYCVSWTLPNVIAARTIARGDAPAWNRDETSRAST
ncbi:glycosyltransferase [Microbacterium sp. BWT-B31]|uniref:glycosyltransferase n=1 Tax=Microbacterium sp. BWT-B31 TaxID=3232072 RepID=UPI0035280933